ncbi:MAG: hypothetical protein ACRD59_19285 [Candidatus Acidiferrales bacterium]
MERGVKVNAGSDRVTEAPSTEGLKWPSRVDIHGRWETQPVGDPGAKDLPTWPWGDGEARATEAGSKTDLGPCLYLGPAGQRCDRRATRDGFCTRHQPGSPAIVEPFLTPKKIAAFFIALAMLWPEIARIAAAILRLFR